MLLPLMDKQRNTVPNNGHHSALPEAVPTASRPDPQVKQRATRRRFTAADKLRILAEADACKQPGQLGALLRREGLYSSTLLSFRKQRDAGKLGKDPQQVRQQRLDKEAARQRDTRKIAHLEAENKKLKILLELQKKVAELMSLPLENPSDL
jgi:transposase-like protein